MPEDKKVRTCQVPGCNSKHYGKGYCKKHSYQIKKYGPLKPANEHNKKNEIIINGNQAEIIIWDKYKKKQVKAIIDSEDVEKIKDYYWHLSPWKVISARELAPSMEAATLQPTMPSSQWLSWIQDGASIRLHF